MFPWYIGTSDGASSETPSTRSTVDSEDFVTCAFSGPADLGQIEMLRWKEPSASPRIAAYKPIYLCSICRWRHSKLPQEPPLATSDGDDSPNSHWAEDADYIRRIRNLHVTDDDNDDDHPSYLCRERRAILRQQHTKPSPIWWDILATDTLFAGKFHVGWPYWMPTNGPMMRFRLRGPTIFTEFAKQDFKIDHYDEYGNTNVKWYEPGDIAMKLYHVTRVENLVRPCDSAPGSAGILVNKALFNSAWPVEGRHGVCLRSWFPADLVEPKSGYVIVEVAVTRAVRIHHGASNRYLVPGDSPGVRNGHISVQAVWFHMADVDGMVWLTGGRS